MLLLVVLLLSAGAPSAENIPQELSVASGPAAVTEIAQNMGSLGSPGDNGGPGQINATSFAVTVVADFAGCETYFAGDQNDCF